MAETKKVIWSNREAKYFCERGWTGKSLICPTSKNTSGSAGANASPATNDPYQAVTPLGGTTRFCKATERWVARWQPQIFILMHRMNGLQAAE
jgi:hypothetical protein